ncbi:MAG: glycine cleavage system protein H [Chloroflexota bacterium]|nr:glycine cleavage system protein H [Chloroflexota bacterium]
MDIAGYELRTDRAYQPDYGCWVQAHDNRLTVGLDALTQDSYGDLVVLQLAPTGTRLEAGGELGSLEAGKFVGALRCPVAGRIVAVNADALENPGLVNREPYDRGWLVVVEVANPAAAMSGLLQGAEARTIFEERVRRFQREGVLAD